jgi:hypothetical protein
MNTYLTTFRRLLPLGLPLLLSACAVSQQGGKYQFGMDPDELTATKLQEFQLGGNRGVLRRTQQQQVQIKLYDRMKLIDLGRIDQVRVGDALRFPGHDLILLHVPTANCPYAYRLYQLNGYEVGMWDINNRPGNCNVPLSFSADGQAWMAQQQSNRPDRQVWAWSGGQLINGPAPGAPAATGDRGGSVAGGFQPGSSATPAPKAATGMRFESADGSNRSATGGNAAPSGSTPATPAATPAAGSTARATASAAPAAAPANNAKRIDAGNYARMPVPTGNGGGQVVAPTRIILRNSNGDQDAAQQK